MNKSLTLNCIFILTLTNTFLSLLSVLLIWRGTRCCLNLYTLKQIIEFSLSLDMDLSSSSLSMITSALVTSPSLRSLTLKQVSPGRFLQVENRYIFVENRFIQVENRFGYVENRFIYVENRFILVSNRFI